jgi:hypothetical protein
MALRVIGRDAYGMVYRLTYNADPWSARDYFVRLVGGNVDAYGQVGDFDSTKDPKMKIDLDANIKNE